MKVIAAILALLLVSCAPFVQSNREETRLGITINHAQAADFVMNLFSHKEDASTFFVNEK